jgi:hypothetical protein
MESLMVRHVQHASRKRGTCHRPLQGGGGGGGRGDLQGYGGTASSVGLVSIDLSHVSLVCFVLRGMEARRY